jgi:hypothetical protein
MDGLFQQRVSRRVHIVLPLFRSTPAGKLVAPLASSGSIFKTGGIMAETNRWTGTIADDSQLAKNPGALNRPPPESKPAPSRFN